MATRTALVPPDDDPRPGGGRRSRKRNVNGEGSIWLRKDGRYEGRLFVPQSDGTVKRKPVYGRSWDDVHTKLTRLKADLQQGIPVEATSQTVGQYLGYWLEHVARPQVRPSTYATYETLTRLYLVPGLGRKRLTKLTAADVRAFLARVRMTCQCCAQGKDLARDRREKGGRDGRRCCAATPRDCCEGFPSAGTVAHLHRLLRAALQDAVEDNVLPRNIAKHVHPGRGKRRAVTPFTAGEATEFLNAARGHRLYALFAVALGIGLRRGEALGLRWSDVDLDAGVLSVRQTLQRVRGVGLVVGDPKTDASAGTLALPAQLVAVLRAHQTRQKEDRTAAGEKWQASGYVFTTRTGGHLEPRNINRTFGLLCAKAGVRSVRFHDLRHSCASLLYAQGVDPGTIRAILRHSTLGVTMDVYVDVFEQVRGDAAGRLGYLFENTATNDVEED